ncbi:MAG: OmpH family outer membrane protein [Rickettsiales bacterium]
MKLRSIYAVAAAAVIAYTPVANAADSKNMIAVVNIQQVMKDSTAAKSVREQLEKKQKSFQAGITKKEKELKKEDQELAKQRNVLSKEAFEKKAREFRNKATNVQKEVQSKKALLDNAFERSLGDIQKATTEIIADLAEEKGFSVAVPTSQILYADSSLDISDEVLSRLNKKLPKVNVKFDK